jgi:hypothetical protein
MTDLLLPQPVSVSGVGVGVGLGLGLGRGPEAGNDAEALEREPFGPTGPVRCPGCRHVQEVAVDAVGYRCGGCDTVWRWAVCRNCEDLALTRARQESWRCAPCGGYSRSWWRTSTGFRDATEVRVRKRAEVVARERRRAVAAAERRRWKVVAAGVVAVVLVGLGALVFTSSDAGSPDARARAACVAWTRLRSDVTNGALTSEQLRTAVHDLAAVADGATSDVALAAGELAAAGLPGTPAFRSAATHLTTACP